MTHQIFSLCSLVCLVSLSVGKIGTAADKPNILFIAVDDLNDWEGCLGGHPQAQTPFMDRLAKRGTIFANAHCQAPLCNSSRTSLMTGLRPSTTGVYALQPWFREVEKFKDHVTLPQSLKQHGYRTLTTGKIYHGGYPPPRDRQNEFDVYGPASSVGAKPDKKLVTTPQGNHPLVDWGTFPHKDEDKGDWKVASWAVDQLGELKTQTEDPFFLSVGFFLPHVPCYATQKWFDLYPENTLIMPQVPDDDRNDVPEFSWYLYWNLPEVRLSWLKQNNEWKPLVRAYLASVSFVDSQVGRVLDALDENGLADNTVVILWSDHGWHLGEKAISGKNTLWHESTRVPLIFAGPGIEAGAICKQPAELLDMYPTILDITGLPANEKLEGHSLLPQLKDADAKREWPAITTQSPGNHSVVNDTFRYIHYADGSEELYDFVKDPNEWHSLADSGEHAEIKAKLKASMPTQHAPPAPGSVSRLLIEKDGVWYWEGKAIDPADKIE